LLFERARHVDRRDVPTCDEIVAQSPDPAPGEEFRDGALERIRGDRALLDEDVAETRAGSALLTERLVDLPFGDATPGDETPADELRARATSLRTFRLDPGIAAADRERDAPARRQADLDRPPEGVFQPAERRARQQIVAGENEAPVGLDAEGEDRVLD